MFRSRIDLRRPADAGIELGRFQAALSKSGLPEVTSALLWEQVETALHQLRDQMMGRHTQVLSVQRVFEGDGYSVSIIVRHGEVGFFSKLMRAIKG